MRPAVAPEKAPYKALQVTGLVMVSLPEMSGKIPRRLGLEDGSERAGAGVLRPVSLGSHLVRLIPSD